MSFPCLVCDADFSSTGTLRHHTRLVHQNRVAVQYVHFGGQDKAEEIKRSQDGTFHCVQLPCIFTHNHPQAMQKHALTCQGTYYDNASTATATVEEDNAEEEGEDDLYTGAPPSTTITPSTNEDASVLHAEMGWSVLLSGSDMMALQALLQQGKDVPVAVVAAADLLFVEMQGLVKTALPGHILILLQHGIQEGQQGKNMGRAMGIGDKSVASYRSLFHKLVNFLVNAHTVDGEDSKVACLVACFQRDRSWTAAIADFVEDPTPSKLSTILLTMMVQPIIDRGHRSPMCMFLALLAISADEHFPTWRQAKDYSPLLSRLLYGLRLAYIGSQWYRLEEEQEQAEQSNSQQNAQLAAFLDNFVDTFQSYFGGESGKRTAYFWVCRMQGRAMGMAKAEEGGEVVQWSHDQQTISIHGQRVVLQDLKETLQAHLVELEKELDSLFHGRARPVPSLLNALQDNPEQTSNGFHFLQMLQNREIVDRQNLHAPLDRFFMGHKEEALQLAMRRFLVQEGAFSLHLAFLLHTTSGYCNRQTELSCTTWCNTVDHTRDVLLYPAVRYPEVLVTSHHSKTKGRKGYGTINNRFVAPALAKILLSYLLCIRPISDQVRAHLGYPPVVHLFLSGSGTKAMTSTNFGHYFSSQKVAGETMLKAREWRHVINAIGRVHLNIVVQAHGEYETGSGDEENQLEQAQAAQANHSVHTSKTHYGRNTLLASKMLLLEDLRTVSRSLQRWLGLLPGEGVQKRKAAEPVAEERTSKVIKAMDTTSDSKVTVSYSGTAVSLFQAFIPLQRPMLSPPVVHAFHRLVGPSVGLRDARLADALYLATNTSVHLFAILATGVGKTLLWQIPALLEKKDVHRKMTVVVLPFVALLDDTVRRCKQAGLVCLKWLGQPLPAELVCDVVAVTIDRAVSAAFCEWLGHRQVQGEIARVVLDEAHVLVTDKHYRPKLCDVHHIVQAAGTRTPFLLLSATVPEWVQEQLCKVLQLGAISLVRMRSHRSNLAYAVHKVSNAQQAEEEICKMIKKQKEQPGSAILIISRYLETGRKLAHRLGCGFFGGKIEERMEGQEALEEFMQHRGTVIVGSSAIGTGLHHPSIRLVVSFGYPYSLHDWAQQSGRAGRDQKPASAIIVGYPSSANDAAGQDGKPGQRELDQFVSGQVCRRGPLGAYLDGLVAQCVELGGELCDVCERGIVTRPVAKESTPALSAWGTQEEAAILAEVERVDQETDRSASSPSIYPREGKVLVQETPEQARATSRTFVPPTFSRSSTISSNPTAFASPSPKRSSQNSWPESIACLAKVNTPSCLPKHSTPITPERTPLQLRSPHQWSSPFPSPLPCTPSSASSQRTEPLSYPSAASSSPLYYLSQDPARRNDVQHLRMLLDFFETECALCWARGLPWHHQSSRCTVVTNPQRAAFRSATVWQPNTCCFKCGRPDEFCTRQECRKEAWKVDVVRDLLLGMLTGPPVRVHDLMEQAGADKMALEAPLLFGVMPPSWLKLAVVGNRKKAWAGWVLVEKALLWWGFHEVV